MSAFFGLFWAAVILVLFFTCCFYDLLLHVVFVQDIGKHLLMFFCFDFALTQILLLFSFITVRLWFDFGFLLCFAGWTADWF